jgi:membrane-associated phospholipid phosphatase
VTLDAGITITGWKSRLKSLSRQRYAKISHARGPAARFSPRAAHNSLGANFEGDLLVFDYVDKHIVGFLNHFAGKSNVVDSIVLLLADEAFWAVLLVCLVWYYWFKSASEERQTREWLTAGLLATAVAGALSRAVQLIVQSHARPIHDPSVHFHLTVGVDPAAHSHWNSFPSDHAAIYFALATLSASQSRIGGTVAYVLASLSAFARVYVGYHWPSDILGGAIVGITLVLVARVFLPNRFISWIVSREQWRPAVFYCAAFLFSYLVATLFIDIRDTARVLLLGIKDSTRLISSP